MHITLRSRPFPPLFFFLVLLYHYLGSPVSSSLSLSWFPSLRQENDSLSADLRRVNGATSFSGDKLGALEAELRRCKAAHQSEASRLSVHVAELEAMNGK